MNFRSRWKRCIAAVMLAGMAVSGLTAYAEEAQPATTMQPIVTEQPEVTAQPTETEQPETTAQPTETEQPETTTQPTETEQPETTAQPTETEQPETTAQPTATEQPETDFADAPTVAMYAAEDAAPLNDNAAAYQETIT